MTADELDALLPQTQCTRCGFEGCLPYAQALALGTTAINRCPPGGAATIEALARALDCKPLPLDPECGTTAPTPIAFIDEARCIGCAKCLPPCPVDAIVGTNRHVHTIVAALCTGCELCIAPCPVDCIILLHRDAENPDHREPPAALNRERFHAHNTRRARRENDHAALLADKKRAAGPNL